MTENQPSKPSFPIKAVLVTFVLTFAFASALYLLVPKSAKTPEDTHDHDQETLYTCSMHPFIIQKEPGTCPLCGMDLVPKKAGADASQASTGERKIAYWKAPMNPREIYGKPGKSAMGMDLVPVYEDQLKGGVDVAVDPVMRQNMGVRVEKARMGSLAHTLRTYGHITYDETRTAQINPRFNGWIETLYVNKTGQPVKKGQPLFSVYAPELISAQEEYLGVYRSSASRPYDKTTKNMLRSIKNRLTNFGLSPSEIKDIEHRNAPKTSVVLSSPMDGVVVDKQVLEGSYFKAGTRVFTLSDLSTIWVEAHIYEYELSLVKAGQEAQIKLPYHPDTVYRGKVAYVYPYMQAKTRDVVVRLEFENPGLSLKPDMYADVLIHTETDKKGILIPEEALIRAGERNLVFLDKGNGTFAPRSVVPGLSMDNGDIHILSGIGPGEPVVVSGQFLLDSESKLQEALRKMTEPETPPEPEASSDDGFFDDM